jgi:hypothetical protein
MKDVVQFALLGLGAGAAYALLGQGIVLVYPRNVRNLLVL